MTLPSIGAACPVPKMRHVRDLEAFDGPILSEFKGLRGTTYLRKWCSNAGGVSRWLVVRSDIRAVAEYLSGRSTMLELLTLPNDDVGIIVDRSRDGSESGQLVTVSGLPQTYLPFPLAKHDESLRPEWDFEPQIFFMDTSWNAKMLGDLERLYLDAFAFAYIVGMSPSDRAQAQIRRRIPKALYSYFYRGGYVYFRGFDVIRRQVPDNDNAKSESVAAASPGVLTISAPTATARKVARAMSAASRDETKKAYQELHSWAKSKDRQGDNVPEHAREDFERLCALLSVDASMLYERGSNPEEDATHLLVAARLVAAYFRRLARLLSPNEPGVEFLAPGVERSDV